MLAKNFFFWILFVCTLKCNVLISMEKEKQTFSKALHYFEIGQCSSTIIEIHRLFFLVDIFVLNFLSAFT